MGLTLWDTADDPYSYSQLLANWNKLDLHDHTSGKGKQIPAGGIANGSIGSSQLANNSVTSAHIVDGTIDLADLSAALLAALRPPVGSIMPWWRPNGSTPVPTGWAVPTGQTLTAGNHDFVGGGSIILPDLRNAFLLGADTSGTGTGTGTPPAIGAAGGSHVANLAHAHAVASHTHTVNGHSHTVNGHTHSVSDHTHGISADGTHHHFFPQLDNGSADSSVNTRRLTFSGSGDVVVTTNPSFGVEALFVPNSSAAQISASARTVDMKDNGAHSHGGATGGSGPLGTGSASPGTDSVGLTTNGATSTTDSQLSATTDIRPKFVGVLYIMKVKN
jgi:hypothetical protein